MDVETMKEIFKSPEVMRLAQEADLMQSGMEMQALLTIPEFKELLSLGMADTILDMGFNVQELDEPTQKACDAIFAFSRMVIGLTLAALKE